MRCVQHGRACGEPSTVVLQPNTTNRYVVRQLLGKGGFARVYLVTQIPPDKPGSTRGESGALGAGMRSAESQNTSKQYALKVISKCRLGDTAIGREALRNEVSIHRRLEHPGIVRLKAFWEDVMRIYLLMELVEGPQLESLVRARGRLTEGEVSLFGAYILEAVSYLHANQIVHRDLKLANVLLTGDRKRVLLCDFGLAAHLDTLREGGAPSVCGTPNYVAPELISGSAMARGGRRGAGKGGKGDAKGVYTTGADLWSMGVLLYTMLVGSGPFDGEDVPRTFRRIRIARFTFPVGLKLSSNAKSLIRLLLSEDLNRRPTADQALRHPFFSATEVPKLMPPVGTRILPCENGRQEIREGESGRDFGHGMGSKITVGDERGIRGDRADGKKEQNSGTRSRRIGGGSRRGMDMRQWSGSYQQGISGIQVQQTSEIGVEGGIGNRNGGIRMHKERPNWTSERRSGGHISTRHLGRAAKERSSSMSTSRTMEKRRAGHGGERVRRSSLNTKGLESVKQSRWAGVTGSGRRQSLLESELRNSVLNLSVSLSAGLLKGRKHLDEMKENAGVGRKGRFEALATIVDGIKEAPPLVRRWLDYTSKYGFATMMEDGRSGCSFNDGSTMVYISEKEGLPNFAYFGAKNGEESGEVKTSTRLGEKGEDGKLPNDISKKACLCTLFADMMADGGRGSMYDLPSVCNVSFLKPDVNGLQQVTRTTSGEDYTDVVHVREWARFRKFRAAAFRLSNHSIHVKFDVGDDRCDDFVFDVSQGSLFYRAARGERAWKVPVKGFAEFAAQGEYVWRQLEVCSMVISRFLE